MSRKLEDLEPAFQAKVRKFFARLDELGIKYLVSETLRTKATQEAYFAQGRKPLNEVNRLRKLAGLWLISEKENMAKVTWTLDSKHLVGKAIDIVPEKDGDFWWNAPDEKWKAMAEVADSFDIEAGYYWKAKDSPHFEEI